MTIQTKVTLNSWLIIGVFLSLLTSSLQAFGDSTIQKCKRSDGSIFYQQDVCPPGTNSSTFAVNSDQSDSLTLYANSGHQYSTTLTINGVTVPGFIDTGATFVVVSLETAIKMHLAGEGFRAQYMQTANGVIRSANKTIPVIKVGKFELYNVEISIVANAPTLIGMSALSQLKFSNENGNMTLSKR
ncbi:retropepsin-like aspartic protease family protein [Solimicrobium silvestre]|uniref:Clan AA aspartic protease, TIGR02281 family n=1 Tax=Solimicrobium silvestre TaxID=2099400 RepID=A0A2S9GWF5_9BURK|nr:retropepsin-like aspartic protease [Solimicrobium silvestre]PRC92052.1 Clan AA aspartic protease, TIGR02281 family [Solimicrobium silvestre]